MQSYSNKVSMTIIKRLPKYFQYLKDLESKGIEKISSKEFGDMMGLTASQIRQDLNAFGAYGQQGYGYRVLDLKEAIRDILGLNKAYNCVIIGAGNLGHAISNYERFHQEGIYVKAMFDVNPNLINKEINGIPVFHMDSFEDFIKDVGCNIAILSVPREIGQEVAKKIADNGIKAILNFVPLDLDVPDDVMVENVNITDSFFTLTYLLNEE